MTFYVFKLLNMEPAIVWKNQTLRRMRCNVYYSGVLALRTGLRYKLGNGKHDKLATCHSRLEAVDSSTSSGRCGAGSVIGETNHRTRGDRAANYCEPMRKRCLDRARGVLDRGEEADRIRDLDAHRIQHSGGIRPARLAAHALNSHLTH